MKNDSPIVAPGWISIPVSLWDHSAIMRGIKGTFSRYNSWAIRWTVMASQSGIAKDYFVQALASRIVIGSLYIRCGTRLISGNRSSNFNVSCSPCSRYEYHSPRDSKTTSSCCNTRAICVDNSLNIRSTRFPRNRKHCLHVTPDDVDSLGIKLL